MSTKNDKIILNLKKQVEEKKAAIKKSSKFTPITNCSIEFSGTRYNINVQQKDGLIALLVHLNALKNSAIELDLLDSYVISGYNIEDWITDLKARLAYVTRKEEENKLKAMEDKLHSLLSNEKKVELEISALEESISKM